MIHMGHFQLNDLIFKCKEHSTDKHALKSLHKYTETSLYVHSYTSVKV